jgi:hypothetical protein
MNTNVNFYRYSVASIVIKWNGIIQPYGFYKTAADAIEFLENTLKESLELYSLLTPNGEIKIKDINRMIFNKKTVYVVYNEERYNDTREEETILVTYNYFEAAKLCKMNKSLNYSEYPPGCYDPNKAVNQFYY